MDDPISRNISRKFCHKVQPFDFFCRDLIESLLRIYEHLNVISWMVKYTLICVGFSRKWRFLPYWNMYEAQSQILIHILKIIFQMSSFSSFLLFLFSNGVDSELVCGYVRTLHCRECRFFFNKQILQVRYWSSWNLYKTCYRAAVWTSMKSFFSRFNALYPNKGRNWIEER